MESVSDMDLVAESLSGNRDAFGQIVSRYQNLICSLAYSATGNLSQSEDLAQETFLTAWKQLSALREPSKLRSWLCGIARNLIHNTLRRQGREPVHHAEELTVEHDSATAERAPVEHAISNEEQAILWRSLERIPEIYREPLVLFYREHQSIEAVAQSLDLSEDAVKQRLSRGRKLLQEEVTAFVEGALRQSAPGKSFAGLVLASLPLKPVTFALASAGAVKGTGIFSALALQIIGFVGPMFGTVWVIRNAKDPGDRSVLKRMLGLTWMSVVLVVAGEFMLGIVDHWQHWSQQTYFRAQAANFWFFALSLLTWQVPLYNHNRRMSAQAAADEPDRKAIQRVDANNFRFNSGMGLVAWCGMMFGGLGWLVARAWQAGDMLAFWIVSAVALLTVAVPACAGALMGEARLKRSRLAFIPTILMYGIIFLMMNWRLDLWIATAHGNDLAAAHTLLPMWMVHLGTAVILAWIAALLAITNRQRALN
jgi:RNA polymerase sigma factor (sigma-70 family)